jgi:hypothetical protein
MTAGAMLTHLTKPFDTSGKSAARRHHRSACDRWGLAEPIEAGAIQPHAQAEASGEAKEGKKKMRRFGKVDIPQEAFIAALKVDS